MASWPRSSSAIAASYYAAAEHPLNAQPFAVRGMGPVTQRTGGATSASLSIVPRTQLVNLARGGLEGAIPPVPRPRRQMATTDGDPVWCALSVLLYIASHLPPQ
ncbi:hypothetical protein EDB89DRAFT_1909723 [Lactarius sanguifluus]|nr:hypothetical protein EDB89DRAFT_1909723 [Lactarius sanguifluus]